MQKPLWVLSYIAKRSSLLFYCRLLLLGFILLVNGIIIKNKAMLKLRINNIYIHKSMFYCRFVILR